METGHIQSTPQRSETTGEDFPTAFFVHAIGLEVTLILHFNASLALEEVQDLV
jgi:hypothetical protein